ncbi:MAG TPA: chemotaxis protein CheA, partial [Candidatus Baltobacteraceae bacterium]|nr:chemotaxis protein CheA [Candidatus Baltobacteraceae bacterium]
EFDKSEFIQYFRDETEELLQQIDSDLLRMEEFIDSGHADPETVNSLFRALHTVKGSAGMLQFTEVQTLGHKLENLCDLLRKDRMPLSEGAVDILFSGRDFLTDLIANAIDGTEAPSGVGQYLERLDSFVAVYEQTSSLIEGTSGEETSFDDGAAEAQSVSMTDIEAFEAEVERLLAEQRAKEEAVYVAPAAPSPEVLELAESAPAAALDEAAVTAPPAAAGKPEKPEKPAAAKRSSAHQTIRVDIDRLDLLLNLVGELVINRTRISDIASTLDRSMKDAHLNGARDLIAPLAKDLADSSALLARTTNEIQESIMKVRMVPIGQVFDRFPRLVRDIAKARGKEVQLKISGAETDLDKTIVDEVGEPLMHLLRNCVDHGLEDPDTREQRGKPRYGTISLNAYHEGNQIIIEVADDGGGIDLQKVRERGIKQGLISADDRPTDREIIELIFTPGFSTAETISDVSGRGVGMDVVKKNILRLKGVFDVDTEPGAGTTFTMKLPLTLAIIQALLVRVADELYAIPLDSVIESQRVEMKDVRTVHGNEVITLRGQVVPLVRVADFFELNAPRDPDKVMIVIVGLQGRQVGLVVDSFQGEQEIVIKPLSDVIGRIPGISGATILGNGSISLIIDVHSLVSEAYAGGKIARAEFSGV